MRLRRHLRNTFLAGIFAAIPVAATVFVIWYVEGATRRLTGIPVPFVGVVVALGVIYLLGLFVTSLLGRFFLKLLDRALDRVPMLREMYRAWKQVALTPGGGEGMFARVVLIPDASGQMRQLGFTNAQGIPGDERTWAVFVPAAPNPTSGRLLLVRRECVQPTDVSVEDAFKLILSGGNFVPPGLDGPPAAPGPRATG